MWQAVVHLQLVQCACLALPFGKYHVVMHEHTVVCAKCRETPREKVGQRIRPHRSAQWAALALLLGHSFAQHTFQGRSEFFVGVKLLLSNSAPQVSGVQGSDGGAPTFIASSR